MKHLDGVITVESKEEYTKIAKVWSNEGYTWGDGDSLLNWSPFDEDDFEEVTFILDFPIVGWYAE